MTDAEKIVRSWLLDRDEIDEVREPDPILRDDPAALIVARKLAELKRIGAPTDLVTVADELDADGILERIGGMPYLSRLVE